METAMTELSTDPIVLGHVAITLIAIVSGLYVLWSLLMGRLPAHSNQVFLLFTFLTSATGYLIAPAVPPPSPPQVVGGVALLTLAVSLYAFYGKHMAGTWRAVYLNVFVLVIQAFDKVPALCALMPTCPAPGGPVFGAAQGAVLLLFLAAGWLAVKRYHPATAEI
jgi:FtsH-binding integral membrane protein